MCVIQGKQEYRRKCEEVKTVHYCENGHCLGENFGYPYCPLCGAKAISRCSSCGAEIPRIPNMLVKHCVMCGKPFFHSDAEVLEKVEDFVQSDASASH